MLRGAAISIALIFLASCFGLGTTFAASPDDTTEKTIASIIAKSGSKGCLLLMLWTAPSTGTSVPWLWGAVKAPTIRRSQSCKRSQPSVST